MITNPIIPIKIMAVICVVLLLLKRKGMVPYIRQILIVALLFMINLRIMIPDNNIEIETQKMEVNVLFVIDNTISMVANDYEDGRERREGVIETCSYIIDELYGAKYAVISFHNDATMTLPLTSDAECAKNAISALYPIDSLYAKGTTINVCRELLEDTLENLDEREDGKTIIFFISDGEITGNDRLDTFEDCAEFISGGAVLGYGTTSGGTMKLYDCITEQTTVIETWHGYEYGPAISKIDEDNLEQIAEDMDIPYVHVKKLENVEDVLEDITENILVETETDTVSGYKDTYYWFAIPFAVLLLFELLVYKKKA